jgi:dTDP-4-amino-4,6-dideoxygalactose transaminase
MEWKIALTEPDIGREEIDAVTKVLESKWLTMGAVTAEFEKQFAEKMDCKYSFAVNNATAALHLANVVLGINSGDEVICPALTFVASANASRYTGADVVFADVVSEGELTIDPADIEARITPRTKAITVVHYAGFPCLMDEIMEIAKRHGLKVIEDCAHAPFAWHEFRNGSRKFVGTIGDVGCFSFFGNKNMTTGEGGMITTNDDYLAEEIRLLRSHGMTSLTYDRHKGHSSGYDVVRLGYNYRMDEIHSAIGLAQLQKIDRLNESRRQVYRWYIEVFKDSPHVIVPFSHRNPAAAACHIMPMVVKDGYEETKARLRQAGIQTSKHYDLIPSFSLFHNSKLKTINVAYPIMTVPLGPSMKEEDIHFIYEVIHARE